MNPSTEHELGMKLKEMYEDGSVHEGEKTTQIHLFGIIYADEIRNNKLRVAEIVKYAEISKSYNTEVYKGIRLSEYVELKRS